MNKAISGPLLFYFNILSLYQLLTSHSQVYLCCGNHIFLAINSNPFQVFIFPIYFPYHAAIDIIFWGWNAQGTSQQVQRSKCFKITKAPEVHGIEMRYFPGLFATGIENGWQW